MSYLLTGISYNGKAQPKPNSVNVVHHLEYDLEHQRISVVGDFLIVNQQPYDGLFWLMHRGNVDFSRVPQEEVISTDNLQTSFLQDIYWSSRMGTNLSLDGRLNAVIPVMDEEIKINFGHQEFLESFSRIDDGRSPFSLHQMKLPADSACLLRVRGLIEGDNYRLMSDWPVNLGVYGGDNLIRLIGKDLVSSGSKPQTPKVGYRSYRYPLLDLPLLELFVDEFYFKPGRYDVVLWTRKDATPIEAKALTPELFLGCKNAQFKDREITWYYAPVSLFHSYGMRVEVKPKQPEPSLVDRVKRFAKRSLKPINIS